MRSRVTILLLAIFITGVGLGGPARKAQPRKEMVMADNSDSTLGTTTDPDELYVAAGSLVESSRAADHEQLRQWLSQESFLSRLDSPERYEEGVRYLRISRLIKAMRKSETPGVRQILVDLTKQKEFLANETRVELLIWASVVLRPAAPEVVQFWDTYCQTDDGTNGLVAKAMADNGSQPAIDLLEKKFAAQGFEPDEKIWWMRTAVLIHRHDVPLLKACQRLLTGPLSEDLRPELVAVLFDYKPSEWHGPDGAYQPPEPELLDAEGRHLLEAIGRHALEHVRLSENLKKVVQAKVTAFSQQQ